MLWQTRDLLDCTKRERVVRWQLVHCALVTRRLVWDDYTCLALEALGAAVDQEARYITFGAVHLVNGVYHSIDPSTRLHVVQPRNDNLELFEEVLAELLHRVRVPVNLDAWAAAHHEFGGDLGLVLADVGAAEQKLSIKVRHVDLVQVDYVNVLDAGQR